MNLSKALLSEKTSYLLILKLKPFYIFSMTLSNKNNLSIVQYNYKNVKFMTYLNKKETVIYCSLL